MWLWRKWLSCSTNEFASKRTILEQPIQDEQRWLQISQQRVPDLSRVTSTDYDQCLDLCRSLSLHISNHHTQLMRLNSVVHKLKEVVICLYMNEICIELWNIINTLQRDVNSLFKQLLSFMESYTTYVLTIGWNSRRLSIR